MATLTPQESSSRWTEAVLKLTKLTRDGRISWMRGLPPPRKPTDAIIAFVSEEVFVAQYDDQRLRFRRVSSNLALTQALNKYALEITDAAGETIWAFLAVEALGDLYQAISYHQAGIGKFVDRLLQEP